MKKELIPQIHKVVDENTLYFYNNFLKKLFCNATSEFFKNLIKKFEGNKFNKENGLYLKMHLKTILDMYMDETHKNLVDSFEESVSRFINKQNSNFSENESKEISVYIRKYINSKSLHLNLKKEPGLYAFISKCLKGSLSEKMHPESDALLSLYFRQPFSSDPNAKANHFEIPLWSQLNCQLNIVSEQDWSHLPETPPQTIYFVARIDSKGDSYLIYKVRHYGQVLTGTFSDTSMELSRGTIAELVRYDALELIRSKISIMVGAQYELYLSTTPMHKAPIPSAADIQLPLGTAATSSILSFPVIELPKTTLPDGCTDESMDSLQLIIDQAQFYNRLRALRLQIARIQQDIKDFKDILEHTPKVQRQIDTAQFKITAIQVEIAMASNKFFKTYRDSLTTSRGNTNFSSEDDNETHSDSLTFSSSSSSDNNIGSYAGSSSEDTTADTLMSTSTPAHSVASSSTSPTTAETSQTTHLLSEHGTSLKKSSIFSYSHRELPDVALAGVNTSLQV